MDPEVCPNCEKVVYDAEGFPAGKFYQKYFNLRKFFILTLISKKVLNLLP